MPAYSVAPGSPKKLDMNSSGFFLPRTKSPTDQKNDKDLDWLPERHVFCTVRTRQEVTFMSKGITICFRTSEWLRSALEAIAREEKRSLSQVIELILEEYVKEQTDLMEQEERRKYSRKPATIPAFVRGADPTATPLHGAVILDISLGGLRISVPRECISEIGDSHGTSQFETSFVLPDGDKPIRIVCRSQRVVPVNGSVYIGASFVDSEFVNYQQLQKYFE
jgi:hypothetical protein